jgi:hypothetical protein
MDAKRNDSKEAARNFELVSRYMGWGDPGDRGLWFVGIEEGSYTLQSREDILERQKDVVTEGEITYRPSSEPMVPGGRRFSDWGGHIPAWVSKIATRLSKRQLDWREYRENWLWMPGSRVFNANLYPLPKQRVVTKTPQYVSLFGVNTSDVAHYQNRCEVRHRRLGTFWKSKRPTATICFGKGEWPKFKDVFGLVGNPAKTSRDSKVECYEVDGRVVILTPFFGNSGMSDARAQEIVGILKARDLKLP